MIRSRPFRDSLRMLLLLLCASACGRAGAADPAADPTGIWWVDRGSARVEITEQQGELHGHIVWLRSPFGDDGCPLADRDNPDTALRSRPVLGLELLRGLRRESAGSGTWSGGELYDPNSGRTYRLSLTAKGPDELELRGFIGIELLGQSVRWFRFEKEPICRAPEAAG